MSAIPLQKYRQIEYPLTPKSTVHFWAIEAFYRQKGPLAGRVKRVGGRWYVVISNDPVVESVVDNIRTLIRGDRDEL